MKKIPDQVLNELTELSIRFSELLKANDVAGICIFEREGDTMGASYNTSGGIPKNRIEDWPSPIAFSLLAVKYPHLHDNLVRACLAGNIWPGPPELAPKGSLPDHRG